LDKLKESVQAVARLP